MASVALATHSKTTSLYGLNIRYADEATSRFWQMVNRRVNEAPELSAMLAAGFQPEITGGGGLAWRKTLADESFLFVNYNDWYVGGEPDEPVWIGGRYKGGPATENQTFAQLCNEMVCDVTLPVAMAFVEKLEKTYGLAQPAPAPTIVTVQGATQPTGSRTAWNTPISGSVISAMPRPSTGGHAVTLYQGRSVSLDSYLRAWKQVKCDDPARNYPHGPGSWVPMTAAQILAEMRRGIDDRINRHTPSYGCGRKWSQEWFWNAKRCADQVNTPRLVVRWVPHDLRKRLEHRITTE